MVRRLTVALAVAIALLALPAQAALVAYYSFDDDTATDLSPNGNHGVVGSAVLFTDDTPLGVGRAAVGQNVRNSTGVIRVPTSAPLQSIDDELTVSFWMRADTDTQTWGRLLQHAVGTEGWRVNRYSSGTDINVRVDTLPNDGVTGRYNQNIAHTTHDMLDDEWHHLVYILDEGRWEKYMDGSLIGASTYLHGNGVGNTNPLYILGRNNHGDYKGLMDEVAVWNHALAPDLVPQLTRGHSPLNIPEPATMALLGLGALALVRRRRAH
jgi:hypothetical protein